MVPGHGEGDLIRAAANRSAIGIPVEHATRSTLLLAPPDGHDAAHVRQTIIDKIRTAVKAVAQLADPGPGRRAGPAPRDRRPGHAGLLLPTRTAHGSTAPTRTPTTCPGNTSPRTQTFPGYNQDHPDTVADEPDNRPRTTLDRANPAEGIIEPFNTMQYAQHSKQSQQHVATTTRTRPRYGLDFSVAG